jgi:hypothetical protein
MWSQYQFATHEASHSLLTTPCNMTDQSSGNRSKDMHLHPPERVKQHIQDTQRNHLLLHHGKTLYSRGTHAHAHTAGNLGDHLRLHMDRYQYSTDTHAYAKIAGNLGDHSGLQIDRYQYPTDTHAHAHTAGNLGDHSGLHIDR